MELSEAGRGGWSCRGIERDEDLGSPRNVPGPGVHNGLSGLSGGHQRLGSPEVDSVPKPNSTHREHRMNI